MRHLGHLGLLLLTTCSATRHEYSRVLMGSPVRVVLYAKSEADAQRAADAAFARIEELDGILSDWRDDSELMRLCRAGQGTVSMDLYRVLRQSVDLARDTGGAFDITVGPLVQLWREARRTGRLPGAAALEAARRKTGWRRIRFDGHEVTLAPGMRLDLGGIGKGYAADEAAKRLDHYGLRHYLIDFGGDLVCGFAPPGQAGWTVVVAGKPRLLSAVAVAASGDTERFAEIDGVRYSHIVDPRTGVGLTERRRVSVIAPSGALADALATAISVRPDLDFPGVEIVIEKQTVPS